MIGIHCLKCRAGYFPTYRERYDQFLRAYFPRVPPPSNAALFRDLTALGCQLAEAHLLRPNAVSDSPASFPVPGDNAVAPGYPKYAPPNTATAAGRVYINPTQYFAGIAPEV